MSEDTPPKENLNQDPSRQNWGTTGGYRQPPVDKPATAQMDYRYQTKLLQFPDQRTQEKNPILGGHFDVFYLETRMMQMIDENLQPIIQQNLKDKEFLRLFNKQMQKIMNKQKEIEQWMNYDPNDPNAGKWFSPQIKGISNNNVAAPAGGKKDTSQKDAQENQEYAKAVGEHLYQLSDEQMKKQTDEDSKVKKTRFDKIDDKLTALEILINTNRQENFEMHKQAGAASDENKHWMESVRKEMEIKLLRATGFEDSLQVMNKEFLDTKLFVKEKIARFTSDVEVDRMKVNDIENQFIDLKQEFENKITLLEDRNKQFYESNQQMKEKQTWMQKKVTEIEQINDLLNQCMENLQTLGNDQRIDSIKNHLTRDKLVTIENYTERYLPIVMVKQLRLLLVPVLDDETSHCLDQTIEKYLNQLATVIAEDQGEGSIAKNILQVNAEMEKLLQMKIDLTRVDQVEAKTALGRTICPRCDFMFSRLRQEIIRTASAQIDQDEPNPVVMQMLAVITNADGTAGVEKGKDDAAAFGLPGATGTGGGLMQPTVSKPKPVTQKEARAIFKQEFKKSQSEIQDGVHAMERLKEELEQGVANMGDRVQGMADAQLKQTTAYRLTVSAELQNLQHDFDSLKDVKKRQEEIDKFIGNFNETMTKFVTETDNGLQDRIAHMEKKVNTVLNMAKTGELANMHAHSSIIETGDHHLMFNQTSSYFNKNTPEQNFQNSTLSLNNSMNARSTIKSQQKHVFGSRTASQHLEALKHHNRSLITTTENQRAIGGHKKSLSVISRFNKHKATESSHFTSSALKQDHSGQTPMFYSNEQLQKDANSMTDLNEKLFNKSSLFGDDFIAAHESALFKPDNNLFQALKPQDMTADMIHKLQQSQQNQQQHQPFLHHSSHHKPAGVVNSAGQTLQVNAPVQQKPKHPQVKGKSIGINVQQQDNKEQGIAVNQTVDKKNSDLNLTFKQSYREDVATEQISRQEVVKTNPSPVEQLITAQPKSPLTNKNLQDMAILNKTSMTADQPYEPLIQPQMQIRSRIDSVNEVSLNRDPSIPVRTSSQGQMPRLQNKLLQTKKQRSESNELIHQSVRSSSQIGPQTENTCRSNLELTKLDSKNQKQHIPFDQTMILMPTRPVTVAQQEKRVKMQVPAAGAGIVPQSQLKPTESHQMLERVMLEKELIIPKDYKEQGKPIFGVSPGNKDSFGALQKLSNDDGKSSSSHNRLFLPQKNKKVLQDKILKK